MTRSYEYGEVFNSLLRYLGDVAQRIHLKNPELPLLSVVYLDSIPDFATLPKGDFIFLTSWTIEASGERYGDIHEMMLGFGVVNDINGTKLETIYMNQLMLEVANRDSKKHTKIAIYSKDPVEVIGLLVYSPDYFTNDPRVDDSRTFRSVKVTMLSPQRLKVEPTYVGEDEFRG